MKALSIRQPWAHLIIFAGKDFENRPWATRVRGPVLIHAAKGMTKREYEECASFCANLPEGVLPADFWFPQFDTLQRGGFVGKMNIEDCVEESDSPWFFGPFGHKISAATSLPFHKYRGALGYFEAPEL